MARKHTKCTNCNDIMWFQDKDPVPQTVVCPCGQTKLTEDGYEGKGTSLTQKEIDNLPEG